MLIDKLDRDIRFLVERKECLVERALRIWLHFACTLEIVYFSFDLVIVSILCFIPFFWEMMEYFFAPGL